MRFMVIVKGNKDSEAGVMPTEKELADMGRFNDELANAGMMLAGEGLKPTSKGVRIRFAGRERTVVNGPFQQPESLVAGYWLLQAKSTEEVVETMRRAPFDKAEIEIRPLYETEDFAAADPTGEHRRREEELRARLEPKRR